MRTQYKGINKRLQYMVYAFRRLYGIIITKRRFRINGVKHESYKCYGIPYIEVEDGCEIVLGNNFAMNNGIINNMIGFGNPCVLRCRKGNIYIGENSGMSQTTLIAFGADITIGNNVAMGGGVKIFTTDFHSLDYLDRRNEESDCLNRKHKSVVIGDDCFIGAGTMILKGVTIGARSVIGAGAVVTKSIPSDEVWAGNPAKLIKKLLST